MNHETLSPKVKALKINLDKSIYGTFAEIGAGQEVARHFFQAGKASQTVAKSMSAYDMTISDEIYGKDGRYVCESRLKKMLTHEYDLLVERLTEKRGQNTRFFAFANTVATHSSEEEDSRSHGWLGVRFQTRPNGPTNDIILHVRMWDRLRLQQQEALGVLGVNLIHLAFFPETDTAHVVAHLMDQLSPLSIEINMLRFEGPDVDHLDNRLLALELVKQGITEAVLFGPDGDVLHVADCLFKTPVLVQRGAFRPITQANHEVITRSLKHFQSFEMNKKLTPRVLLEITMRNLQADSSNKDQVDTKDFLDRVDTLGLLKYHVLISNFDHLFELKSYLRRSTDQLIGIVIGGSHLGRLFNEIAYKSLGGGILEGFSRLLDSHTKILVYPYKSDQVCINAKSFFPDPSVQGLFQHIKANGSLLDILDCDDVDTSIHSKDVRELMAMKNPKWEASVPEVVKKSIIENKLFGYR